jgi:hypothetical protein
VSVCVNVIVAFGTRAPVLSLTVPNNVAVESCATADAVIIKVATTIESLIRFI